MYVAQHTRMVSLVPVLCPGDLKIFAQQADPGDRHRRHLRGATHPAASPRQEA